MTRWFTVYEVVNLRNGRYYRGAHATDDLEDAYLGSGTLLLAAVERYGRAAFEKRYLAFALSEEVMYEVEARLVVTNAEDSRSYNLVPGGSKPPQSPWSNDRRRAASERRAVANRTLAHRALVARSKRGQRRPDLARRNKDAKDAIRRGHPHRPETIALLSAARQGAGHPQFGSRWITDGAVSRKVGSGDVLPAGWRYGRTAARTAGGRFS